MRHNPMFKNESIRLMRKRMIFPILLAAAIVGQMELRANTALLALLPSSGVVSGPPGSTVGWGFDLQWTSGTDWLVVVTSSQLISETTPSILVAYTDFVGPQHGPSPDGALGPGSPTNWTQTFDGVSQGIGSYQINPAAATGAEDTGSIQVNDNLYDSNPSGGTANLPGSGSVFVRF
jgi:hypothetical protein